MIIYTDDDIPIIYNPIQLYDEKKIIKGEPEIVKGEPEIVKGEPETKLDKIKKNVNTIVQFLCCCFTNRV